MIKMLFLAGNIIIIIMCNNGDGVLVFIIETIIALSGVFCNVSEIVGGRGGGVGGAEWRIPIMRHYL